jgi:alpha-2-macroglobulin
MVMVLVLMSGGVYAQEPGFDCAKAETATEKFICSDQRLSALDANLSALYRDTLRAMSAGEVKAFRREQQQWLRKRNTACDIDLLSTSSSVKRECLERLYRERIQALSARSDTETAPLKGKPAPALDSADRPDTPALHIRRITPDGVDVPAGRQVVFQFDRPVVPVGRMERKASEIPIEITPALNCEWRWLNTSALACQLKEADALTPATRYQVSVAPGITSDDGAVMSARRTHRFITERPKVTYARFKTWRAPGWPVIQVTFNQPVSQSSVERHLTFVLETSGRSMPLTASPDENDRRTPHYLPLPGEKLAVVSPTARSTQVDDRRTEIQGEEARRIWVVAPRREMPLDSAVHLKVAPGLVSALGPETGVERRTVVKFNTFPEFRFLGVQCTDAASGQYILIPPDFPAGADLPPEGISRCLPLRSVALVFSAPVIGDEVKRHVTISPDLAGGRKDYDPWANQYNYSRLQSPHRPGARYRVRLPERLQAFQHYDLKSDPDLFKDEFGRSPQTPVNMAFMTAHRHPRMVLVHPKAVLEKEVDTEMPVHVTNIDRLIIPHRVLTAKGLGEPEEFQKKVDDAEDVAFAMPLGLRELLSRQSGAVSGYLDSVPRVPDYNPDYYRFFAQVTPFQVHVKLGHFNSLVWVTDMATGRPVENARVSVYVDNYSLHADTKEMAHARTDPRGLCQLPGIETLDPQLDFVRYLYDDFQDRLFVRVARGDDLALVPLDRYFMTWAGGVGASNRVKDGHMRAWGTTAQGVYKVGDTIQYKFYVRNQSNRHWVLPERSGYTLTIIDPKGQMVQEIKDLTLSKFGAYDGEYALPRQAAVGWYRFELAYKDLNEPLPTLRVLVSDFTPAPFRVSTELNGDRFAPGDRIEISTRARLHAGGPYTNADTRVTVRLRQTTFRSKDPLAKGFTFSSGPDNGQNVRTLHQSNATGDDHGNVTDTFDLGDQGIVFGRLLVEGAVRDDRGKYVTAAAAADYVGRDRFIGLRNTRWVYAEDQSAEIEYLAVNVDGKPEAGLPVDIRIQHEQTKAARVKGAGNAYLTHYVTNWVAAGQTSGTSANAPAVCRFTPAEPGRYRITATVKDSRRRTHTTTIYAWVVGKGRVVWQQENNYTLQMMPDQDHYKVGDTARFLIKNPLPGARALITVERYGVLKQWVQTLTGSTPVVEVPIEADYLPGFYLSVLITSPRVDKPLGEGNVDLGKPTFRLGYLQVPVRDVYKEIDVNITTDRDLYKPRQTVKAAIRAVPRNKAGNAPVEIAVAVIDEAVFDLNRSGRGYYDPYAGFNNLDGLDLNNYSLLMRLVGRQKFEKKGANPGGDGGPASGVSLRNLFKFVCYWNPSIEVDRDGKAEIEFSLPDNLTSWRIFAMAVTPDDRMGLGDVSFKVNRPTELRPVMPNQVLEGDDFVAGFSVMNRTAEARTVKVDIRAAGSPLDNEAHAQASTNRVPLEPFKRKTVWLPIQTRHSGQIRFAAKAGDAVDSDAVEHRLVVNKRRSLVTAATYGTTTQATVADRIAIPEGIFPDAGGISVVASPSVIGNVDGAFRYIRDYPYWCWEQRLTKGVMAAHYRNLKAYLPEELKWPASAALPQETLDDAVSYQAPNGGMTYWVPRDAYVSPYLSAYTALAFNWLRKSGYQIPGPVEVKLHTYLKQFLRRDVYPTFYTRGMASSVRAVALAALAEHGKITLADLQRYHTHVPEMDLFGKAHFLQAAARVPGGRAMALETARLILSHASQSGGKFQFNEPWDDSYSYILATPLRSNCAVLSSLMVLAADAEGKALVGDLPFKQVRAITQSRGDRDHWENTQENVFCLNALTAYSRVYESEKPDMTVRAYLGKRQFGSTRFTDLRDDAVTFSDPMGHSSPGLKSEVRLEKQGPGRLYYATRLKYAPTEDNARRINAGIEIRREYAVERDGGWVLLKSPMQIKRGELVRVDLFLSLPTLRHFVVVDDPVPGGLEPVNTDLATASEVDAAKGAFKAADGSWWFHYSDWSYYGRYGYSFYHKELRHQAARFFADYLPAGNYHLSYTAQAIAAGRFAVMPVHAEEMYDPDLFGKGLPATLTVAK